MNRLVKFSVLVCLLLTAAGTPLSLAAQEKHFPVVVMSMAERGGGWIQNNCRWCYFALINIATGGIYKSQVLTRFYSFIEDIPQGKYAVYYFYCGTESADPELNDSFFGIIDIDSDSIFYLGNFDIRHDTLRKHVEMYRTHNRVALDHFMRRPLRKLRKRGYTDYGIVFYQTPKTNVILVDIVPQYDNTLLPDRLISTQPDRPVNDTWESSFDL